MFPKKCIMAEGSIYTITFEDIKRDWQDTVDQFDDLSKAEQQEMVDSYTEDMAETWWDEQCFGYDIVRLGTFVGIDEDIRSRFLKAGLIYGPHTNTWASDFEVED